MVDPALVGWAQSMAAEVQLVFLFHAMRFQLPVDAALSP